MNLKKARELCEKATPGPWVHYSEGEIIEPKGSMVIFDDRLGPAQKQHDCNYIAFFHPERVKAMLDLIEATAPEMHYVGCTCRPCSALEALNEHN